MDDVVVIPRSSVGQGFSVQTGQRVVFRLQAGVTLLRMFGLLFDTNKSFLLAGATPGLRQLVEVYAQRSKGELLIVGHTDRSGEPVFNNALSLERAETIAAYLTDRVDIWLAQYGSDRHPKKRWGKTEDRKMLLALPCAIDQGVIERDLIPPPGAPPSEHATADEKTEKATRAFQEANKVKHQLVVNGKIDPPTRRALVSEYMNRDSTTLPLTIAVTTHGCGESFPEEATLDGVKRQANRRVELFHFPDGIDPMPPGKISKPGSTEYPRWKAQVVETRNVSGFIPKADQADVAFDSPLLIVNHATRSIDRFERTRSADDRLVRQFKERGEKVCYIINPDDDESAFFTTDRDPSFAIASTPGTHAIATSTDELTGVGGHYDTCLQEALCCAAFEFFSADASRLSFLAHLPLAGVYLFKSRLPPERPVTDGLGKRHYDPELEDPDTLPTPAEYEKIEAALASPDEPAVISLANLREIYRSQVDPSRRSRADKLFGLMQGKILIEVYFVAMRSKKMPLRGIDWSLTAGQEPTLHLLFIRQNGSSTAAAKFAALPDKIFYIPDLNHVHFPPAIPDDEDDDDLD